MNEAEELTALLDRIDPQRHDVDAVTSRLNNYEQLEPDERDTYFDAGGAFGYAGVAPHVLTALCTEAHNAFIVLRDLDGSLRFVFEVGPGSRSWQAGPLYRGHLSESLLEPYLAGEWSPVDDGLPVGLEDLMVLVELLPDDPPGPLRSY